MAVIKYLDQNGNWQTVVGVVIQNEVVQETGNSETAVMSQKAVSDELDGKLSLSGGTINGTLIVEPDTPTSEDYAKVGVDSHGRLSTGQNTSGTAIIDAFDNRCIIGCDQFNGGTKVLKGTCGYIAINNDINHTGNIGINMIPRSGLGTCVNGGMTLFKNNTKCIDFAVNEEGGNIGITSQNGNIEYEFDSYDNSGLRMVVFSGGQYLNANITFVNDGSIRATNFVNVSDVRNKNIIENLNIDIEDIANAPIFKFTWMSPTMPDNVNVGTSAQYWKTILPELVSEANDEEKTLSMQYGVAGLVSSVSLAKKVVEQEARIKALEDAIAEIQNKLK